MTRIVLVCGSRHWGERILDGERLHDKIKALAERGMKLLVHGDCRGADVMAGLVAAKFGVHVMACAALWSRHGSKAGPLRNRAMLLVKPELVVAFHENLEASRGTKDMVNAAKHAGIPVEVVE